MISRGYSYTNFFVIFFNRLCAFLPSVILGFFKAILIRNPLPVVTVAGTEGRDVSERGAIER